MGGEPQLGAGSRRAVHRSPAVVEHMLSIDVEAFHPLSTGRAVQACRSELQRILDLLEHHDCRATFFTVGQLAEMAPDLAARIADAGHDVGIHGWTHTLIHEVPPHHLEEDLIRARGGFSKTRRAGP